MTKSARRIFVGSLPWSVTSEQLKSLFSRVGTVTDAVVLTDKQTGKSKGYGFVEMDSNEELDTAIAKFNGYEMQGRSLVVNAAEPKSPKTLFMS
jgi:RNA recognition motif-containing protein